MITHYFDDVAGPKMLGLVLGSYISIIQYPLREKNGALICVLVTIYLSDIPMVVVILCPIAPS